MQKLRINPSKKDIDSFVLDDFELAGYNPHKKIAMQMAVWAKSLREGEMHI